MTTFEIVLFNPEIPPNTGNIMRLCANTGCNLHIIEPMGFDINEKSLRRAGLDYIKNIKTKIYRDINIFLKDNNIKFYLVSKFGRRRYTELNYKFGDCFIFGSESKGIPENIIKKFKDSEKIFIPMTANSRSLNKIIFIFYKLVNINAVRFNIV